MAKQTFTNDLFKLSEEEAQRLYCSIWRRVDQTTYRKGELPEATKGLCKFLLMKSVEKLEVFTKTSVWLGNHPP